MESSNEPVSPFDPYEHVANLTLHDESPLKALAKPPEPPPEYKPRNSTSAASAHGRLEGLEDSSSASYNGNLLFHPNQNVHFSYLCTLESFLALRYESLSIQ